MSMDIFKGFRQPILIILIMNLCIIADVQSLKVRGYFKCKAEPQKESTNTEGSATDGMPTTEDGMYTQEGNTVYTATTNEGAANDEVTTESINGSDCFEVMGNKRFQIENGSSAVAANCTRIISCNNGTTYVQQMYNCSPNAVCKIRNDLRKCYCITDYHGDREICPNFSNCLDVFNAGYTTSGVYTIKPSNWNGSFFNVSCNMSEGGGWTVFQRRVNGSVDFYRNWSSYKQGFGEPDHEFWLGNDKIYFLTNQGNCTLRIDLVTRKGNQYYAEYNLFRINNENDNYRLSGLGVFNGTAGHDALRRHMNCSFSTFDRDNDEKDERNCAEFRNGAWWYRSCLQSNLNGNYSKTTDPQSSIFWKNVSESNCKIIYTEMKIRPKM